MISYARNNIVAEEGAWCWFADPRALHYENEAGTINATYLGYIDVHGNVKATQYDWVTHRKTDVLIRSYFQPDDHNNPTFLVLPDERVMIFYTRHTDEPKIWYRVSVKPGDITALGEEKFLATANNTTYPSPFILSDDPNHIYLCWRGIGWHPTIARITMPDANDDCQFDFGPKQIVQSTGARPYAKYCSNGKDKIYVSYTTGHPDNEMPDWLYFNVIDINGGNGPILRDLNGSQLSIINNGVFNVNKSDSYASQYPATIVDKTANVRNWVWQIALDENEHPVIAYPHIDNAKTGHSYWYAQWNGTKWVNTRVELAGHAFHQNWNQTERCYSGGMSLDPDNPHDLYISIPVKDNIYNKDGVYEIWKYVVYDGLVVAGSQECITMNSPKNNARPYVIPGSKNSPMRVAWMQGDYYYWMVNKNYPIGYPTSIMCDYDWQEELTQEDSEEVNPRVYCTCLGVSKTVCLGIAMNASKYTGTLFTADNLTYAIDEDYYPVVTIGSKTYRSQNRLLTSDDWATKSTGTSGDNHPTKLLTWVLTISFDGKTLSTYRNGLVDQVIETNELIGGVPDTYDLDNGHVIILSDFYGVASPLTVQQLSSAMQTVINAELGKMALNSITLPAETRTDLLLPKEVFKQPIIWTSSNERVISNDGVPVASLKTDTEVTLIATIGAESRAFTIKVLARDITKNQRYAGGPWDMTANSGTAFTTNTFGLAPWGLLDGLRSYTFLVTVNAKSLTGQPRIYDFGPGSGNSVFLRANPLAAGIKYNGGTTTMVNATTQLTANKEYKLAVTFDAGTKTTRIFIDGKENVNGTANQNEAYMLREIALDTRNYIGRTQWWDSDYYEDNQDFVGTISDFKLFDVALTAKEICEQQGIEYEQKELPTALQNGDFEGNYLVMSNSGVRSDRAIYLPEGWTIDYLNANENDLTALKSGDLYFSNFFASRPKPSDNSLQTYWIRQNWGTSTIALKQEMRLPEGQYTLTADVWKSGLGGDAYVQVETQGGATVSAPSLANKEEWQRVTLSFESDGDASSTVRLTAMHNSDGSEKIIGFDNVVLTKEQTDAVSDLQMRPATTSRIYDLQGRLVTKPGKGIFVQEGRKVVR